MYTQQLLLLIVLAATTISAQLSTTFSVETKTEKGYEHPNTHFHGFVLDSVFTHHANLHHSNGENARIQHTITRRKLTFRDNHPSLLPKDELIQRRLLGRELAKHTAAKCTDPDKGTTCNEHNANSATCITTARRDAGGKTCVFNVAGDATCTGSEGSGTMCNANNADSSTCLTKPRTDAAGATCIFADDTPATCTDPDGGFTCNAFNADSATCIANTDDGGSTCVFTGAIAASCSDTLGTACSAYNADSATCTTQAREDAAGDTCVFTAGAATCIDPSAPTCTDPDGGKSCNRHSVSEAACIIRTDDNGDDCVFTPTGTTCAAHNADQSTCTTQARTDAAGATCIFKASRPPMEKKYTTSSNSLMNASDAFDNMHEEFLSLDVTSKLSRNKVRALAKFTFLNAAGAYDTDYYKLATEAYATPAENDDVWFSNKETAKEAKEEDNEAIRHFLNATMLEANAVADGINATIQENDVPNREAGQGVIGVVCLLLRRGEDIIVWWRDTTSPGDAINIESWFTSAITDNEHGMSQWRKDKWILSGLEWTDEIQQIAEVDDVSERVALQTALYAKKTSLAVGETTLVSAASFNDDLVTAVNGKKIGGRIRNGKTPLEETVQSEVKVSLTLDQATKQGYWPVTKQIIEQIRTELMGYEGLRTEEEKKTSHLLISGHSQGGGRAQLHRMYLQKKYEEKPPVVTFAATGPACFSRNLDGPGRTELLNDVDPTLFYKDVTDYEHFFDPWGTGIGPDVGTSCSFGRPKMPGFGVGDVTKNELREMKKTRAYKYCSKIVGISAPRLMEALALNKQPLKNEFAACRFFTHTQISIMTYLSNDDDLLEDGTTNGGCVKYNPDSMVCPTQSMFIAGLGIGIFVLVMVLVMCLLCLPFVLWYKGRCCFSYRKAEKGDDIFDGPNVEMQSNPLPRGKGSPSDFPNFKPEDIKVHTDKKSGRQYTHNKKSGEVKWLPK